jgi:PAS domain S-box-containing protein
MLGAVEDISERHLAQERLEALLRHAADAVIVVDGAGILRFASPSATELTGVEITERLGTDALALVHPDDHVVVATSLANTAGAEGTAVPLRFRIVRGDGQERYVEAVATNLLDEPAVSGIVVYLRDLTDREEARTALQVQEIRFRRMLENISDTVTLIDGTGEVIDTTGNVKEILGYPNGFWSVRNAFDLAHPDDVDRLRRMLVELVAQPGRELTGEFRVRHADGHYEHIEATGVNLLDEEDVRAVVITSRNVTRRRQVEEELARARDEAVRALQVRTEFVASVSHELRTPIHGVLGLSELLVTANVDEEARSLARSISRATETLRMVLDDLLDFTKVEAGRLELHEQPMAVAEVIEELRSLLGPQAAAKGVAMRTEIGAEVPAWITADPLRVRQVLTNLIGNAVKFTAEGSIVLAADRATDEQGRPAVVLTVSDTGIGMAPDVVERVFDPFSQAHASTAREYGGTGLGLTIARRLVELMGGDLRVTSEPGRGSTFTCTLPLHAVASTHPRVGADPPPRLTGRGRVMVVEDNAVNQLLVSRQLERLGYEPIVLDGGSDALETFAADPPDVVLMDWQMPGMDGLETTRRLRRLEVGEPSRRVPVIAMTASAMPGDRARCLDAGMDDFVSKPVSLAALGRVLARWTTAESRAAGDRGVDGSAVDADTIRRLLEELEDADLVATVLRTYLRELPGRLRAIEDAARRDDRDVLGAAAHTLKSTSAAVGAGPLADRCARFEAWGRAGALLGRSVDAELVDLAARADEAQASLQAVLERLRRLPEPSDPG